MLNPEFKIACYRAGMNRWFVVRTIFWVATGVAAVYGIWQSNLGLLSSVVLGLAWNYACATAVRKDWRRTTSLGNLRQSDTPRPWPRFSTRALFVLTTVVAVLVWLETTFRGAGLAALISAAFVVIAANVGIVAYDVLEALKDRIAKRR